MPIKISEMNNGSPAQATDELEINRADTTFRVNANSIAALNSLYTTNGTLLTDRTVTGNTRNLIFNGLSSFQVIGATAWDLQGGGLSLSMTSTGTALRSPNFQIADTVNDPATASAILELKSSTRGFLPARGTSIQRLAIVFPATRS